MQYSFSSYIGNLFNILPVIVLPLIIINHLGEDAAGFYYLAFMMANLLYSIAYALSQSVIAEGSYAQTGLRSLVKKSAVALSVVMIPASAALALLGPFILELFGKSYSTNSHALVLVFAASGPCVAAYIFGCAMLRILKKNKTIIMVNAFYAAVIAAFVLLWVDKGVAWVGFAWLIGNLASAVLMLVLYSFGAYNSLEAELIVAV